MLVYYINHGFVRKNRERNNSILPNFRELLARNSGLDFRSFADLDLSEDDSFLEKLGIIDHDKISLSFSQIDRNSYDYILAILLYL